MRRLNLVRVSVLLMSAPVLADAGVWLPTGPLSTIRADATATLLPSGKVLVAGGSGASGEPSNSAELYDPAVGSWAPTGSLGTARRDHTATMLPNGRVLVVGGFDSSALANAELYDPAKGTWEPTDEDLVAVGRFQHTATLLPSGEVLVAGGFGKPGEALSSAELYNSATGGWSTAPAMTHARGQHTATLLASGLVLVAGGRNGQALVAEAEVYGAGGWDPAGRLSQPRICHTATLLASGRVIVAGGARTNRCGAEGSRFTPAKVVELYDPSARSAQWWSSTSPMLASRASHSAVLLVSGKVLVAGGLPPSGAAPASDLVPGSEIFDETSAAWQPAGDLHALGGHLRRRHTSTLLPTGNVLLVGGDGLRSAELFSPQAPFPRFAARARTLPGGPVTAPTAILLGSGKVLLAGGSFKGAAIAQAWIYDPPSDTWRATRPLNVARVGHSATLLPSGEVFVVGGRTRLDLAQAVPVGSVEVYDPDAGTWRLRDEPRAARSGHTATLLPSGEVLIAGGAGRSALWSAFLYDPVTRAWTRTGQLEEARFEHAAVLLPTGNVLVAGGSNGAPIGSAELYSPELRTWSATGSLLIPRRQATATLLPAGRVLLAGGFCRDFLSETEIYDSATGRWVSGSRLETARSEHRAVLLPSGKTLIVGGSNGDGRRLNTAEVFDPALSTMKIGNLLGARRLPAAVLLPSGNVLVAGGTSHTGDDLDTTEILDVAPGLATRRPVISSTFPDEVRFGEDFRITGRFRSALEAGGGGSNSSAVNYPLVQLISLEGGQLFWLAPGEQENFWDDPMTLTVSHLPAGLNPGWHRLSVFTSGRAGTARLVQFACSLKITRHPSSQTVSLGSTATFSVGTEGGRAFQWQRCDQDCDDMDPQNQYVDIAGATGADYTTPGVDRDDSGARYRVKVEGGCRSEHSLPATLTIQDSDPPVAEVLSPSGGEYWVLPEPGEPPSQQRITWSMSDNVRICKVSVWLEYSQDGGKTYVPAPDGGGLPAQFGDNSSCEFPGVTQTSTTYILATDPPAALGSLYRIRLLVTNQARRAVEAHSPNPFYVVRANPESVRTLILANLERMRAQEVLSENEEQQLSRKLQELAAHPRVQGLVVDLSAVGDITGFYAEWDGAGSDAEKAANRVLFGCHLPGCDSNKHSNKQIGIKDKLQELLAIYPGVKYLVLIGDDRIIPFARVADRTTLLLESRYTKGTDLSPSDTTVGQALGANTFLSDDPLATRAVVDAEDLTADRGFGDRVFVPDLAVGRLVENPEDIIITISSFISRDGILDLRALDADTGHKVLITGYDFLRDSGRVIRERWKNALGLPRPHANRSIAPVNGTLLTEWDEDIDDLSLRHHLCGGDEGPPYAIAFLNGHATHHQEGVPGSGPFDIRGLSADAILGDLCRAGRLSLDGAAVFTVGCHGGLPVADCLQGEGGCPATSHRLDLPQVYLARGAVAYVANTGFGWGLLHGIGYAERLAQILAEEMTSGGVIVTGEAVRRTKLRYFLEARGIDPYDEKSLLQWTFFGLPMYAVRTGIGAAASGLQAPFEDLASTSADRERLGPVTIERRLETSSEAMAQVVAEQVAAELPAFLTRLDLRFDLRGPGVYVKRNAAGDPLPLEEPCFRDAGSPNKDGCYYTLHGLVDRATGASDLPIQPYLIYDSRLAGTSQHGVLWKGGTFVEESGWKPVIAQLTSNVDRVVDHGSLPPHDPPKPKRRKRFIAENVEHQCPVSDLEVNSLFVPAGEALKLRAADPSYTIQRRYTTIDLEVFYFNDTEMPERNCDELGPDFGQQVPPYHRVDGEAVKWDVPVTDDSDVWRVVVVYNKSDDNRWIALDLHQDPGGRWKGEIELKQGVRLDYVLEAVDSRGNVSWLDFEPAVRPNSGVEPDVPLVVEVMSEDQ